MRRSTTIMVSASLRTVGLVFGVILLGGCAGNPERGRVIDISGGENVLADSSTNLEVAGEGSSAEVNQVASAGRPGELDGDGIVDDVDRCPDVPEDRDGFQDDDGCPEPDNDGDGILDRDDKCPNEPENMNGFEDADGCPETNLNRAKQAFRDGAVAFAQADYATARKFFEEAYNLEPRDPVLYNIAMAADKQGDRKSACLYYRKWQTTSHASQSGHRIASLETCP